MKQHITIEQLQELTYEQIKCLEKYAGGEPILYPMFKEDWICSKQRINSEVAKGCSNMHMTLLEYITIGRMIEILSKEMDFVHTNITDRSKNEINCAVECGKYVYNENTEYFHLDTKKFKSDELCDALWKAVKEILKEGEV